jgi:hypothetical protein
VTAVVPQPEIPEFRGFLQLGPAASRLGAAIGRDRDELAQAILRAYAAGEFDSLQGAEAVCGYDRAKSLPFDVDKSMAELLSRRQLLRGDWPGATGPREAPVFE